MIDPVNTLDGKPCRICGDDAVAEVMVQRQAYPVALCGPCLDDAITRCPDCEMTIFTTEGIRLYATANLYCSRCAAKHPVFAVDAEAQARYEEARDRHFEDVRRG